MKAFEFLNFKNYNLINIFGLFVGIVCVLTIMLWVEDELKFDSFNKNADRIYRVIEGQNDIQGYSYSAMTMAPLAKALKEKIPEIEKVASFEMDWPVVVKAGENYFNENGMAAVGKDFFDIFSFPFVNGNPQLIKTDKHSVVLSEKIAKKYFGEDDPIGKFIEIDKKAVKVIAILKNIDFNSHISFDLAISEDLFGVGTRWDSQSLYTYIQVVPEIRAKHLAPKISDFLSFNDNPEIKKIKLILQPIQDIHFQRHLADEDYTNIGDKKYVYIFSFMGLFILILACINFINLSTAVSQKDIKNNGIQKILGASKKVLIRKSLFKSLQASLIATGISLGILFLILPHFNTFTHKALSFDFTSPSHILFLISIVLFSGILSGLYPAFYTASFSPLGMIKVSKGGTNQWQRKGLVVFQFFLSIFLIIVTLVSFKQFNYIRQVNLGFDKEQTIYFRLETDKSGYQTVKERLKKMPGIEMVGGINYFSSTIMNTSDVQWLANEQGKPFSQNQVDEDYFSLLKVNISEGHSFSNDLKSEWGNSVIINQKAKEIIGNESPLGKTLHFWGKQYNIIGVIDNIHIRSVQESIQPEFYIHKENPTYVLVKYNNHYFSSIDQLTSQIRTIVKDIYPNAPVDFQFLDATYAHLYESDKRIGTIFCIVAIIAIFISSLGLFGLSSYSSKKRTKEIGIRKINGATISEVMAMLNKDFVKWVVIAFIIATPIAYYAMHKWLENFAYKTTLSWWIFAMAGLLALGIALLTVSWQSWRAATRNPVEALRYE